MLLRKFLWPFFLFIMSQLAYSAPAPILVSIAPIHSLACALLKDVTTPELLWPAHLSPHSAQLTASRLKAIDDAACIIWVGPHLESQLVKALHPVERASKTLTLESLLPLRTARQGQAWSLSDAKDGQPSACGCGHAHHEQDHHQHDHHALSPDPHFWLDPQQAAATCNILAEKFTDLFPDHAERILAQRDALIARLQDLDQNLQAMRAAHGASSAIVLHDAYAYFEDRYALPTPGVLILNPHFPQISPHHLEHFIDHLRTQKISVLYGEPQFDLPWIHKLAQQWGLTWRLLDPLGVDLTPGPDLYFILMQRLAEQRFLKEETQQSEQN